MPPGDLYTPEQEDFLKSLSQERRKTHCGWEDLRVRYNSAFPSDPRSKDALKAKLDYMMRKKPQQKGRRRRRRLCRMQRPDIEAVPTRLLENEPIWSLPSFDSNQPIGEETSCPFPGSSVMNFIPSDVATEAFDPEVNAWIQYGWAQLMNTQEQANATIGTDFMPEPCQHSSWLFNTPLASHSVFFSQADAGPRHFP